MILFILIYEYHSKIRNTNSIKIIQNKSRICIFPNSIFPPNRFKRISKLFRTDWTISGYFLFHK
ncbi:hypothetical protein CH381_00510 [Leptospira sp. mixed culture ATI2-C-A1]|nr:hypothetical protein CH381_00510 [Leptospira sp. mixed culture ATI2-C-A1]